MSFDGGAYPVSALNSLNAMAAGVQLTQVYPMLQQLSDQLASLQAEIAEVKGCQQKAQKPEFDQGGWLDATKAQKYLSMSKNTFDKHVYSAEIKIPKHLVGGKNFFQKKDLDLFMMTWEDKNLGFA